MGWEYKLFDFTTCHTHHKEPHNKIVMKECYVSSYDELLVFCPHCSDPIEDPLKFHCVIPPSQTLVTPVDVNNTLRGGIPTNFHNNDRCLKDVCRVFHLTDVSLQVSSRNGLTDRLMALFLLSMPAGASPRQASPKHQGLIYGCVSFTWLYSQRGFLSW